MANIGHYLFGGMQDFEIAQANIARRLQLEGDLKKNYNFSAAEDIAHSFVDDVATQVVEGKPKLQTVSTITSPISTTPLSLQLVPSK